MVENDHFYVVRGWMINELKLKGTELVVYAVIYSFTQGIKAQNFTGSAQYLANWTNSTMRSVQMAIKSLNEKGYLKIIKIDATHNAYNVIIPEGCKNSNKNKTYEKTSQDLTKKVRKTYEKTSQDLTKKFRKTYEKTSHNINNNINNNIYKTDRLLINGCLSVPKNNIPTLEEVTEYVEANGLPIDPKKFYEKNEERGWITKNGEPIKRWKSVLWSWAETEYQKPKPDKNSFMQNTYDFEALEKDLVRN